MSKKKNSDCGCKKPKCHTCNESYTIQVDCCNTCGSNFCQEKNCCSSCNEGPMEVTNEELGSECSWLWISVWRNCCQQPVRVSPSRLRAFLTEGVNFNDMLDYDAINQKVCDLIDEKAAGFVSSSAFLTLKAKVDKNSADLSTINSYLAESNFVTSSQLTQAISGINSGLDTGGVNALINAALEDYYTKDDTDALIANLQNQITTLGDSLSATQAQLDACDCGNGGGGTTTVPPTLDSTFSDLTANVCPQCIARTVTNPDGVQLNLTSTGAGVVSASVNGTAITDLSAFNAPDGSSLEICLTGGDGETLVGGIALGWLNAENETQVLDGLSYNVDCPAGNTNSSPIVTCPADLTVTVGEAVSVAVSATDADNDTIVYSANGLPASLTIDASTGAITGNVDTVGTFTITAAASDGQITDSCSFVITSEQSTTFTISPSCDPANGNQTECQFNFPSGTQLCGGTLNGFDIIFQGATGTPQDVVSYVASYQGTASVDSMVINGIPVRFDANGEASGDAVDGPALYGFFHNGAPLTVEVVCN